MARRLYLAAAIAVVATVSPAGAQAATAPTDPPTLTSTPYVAPATFTWTPAVNGPDLLDPNTTQQVFRGDGVCPPGAVTGGGAVGQLRPMTVTTHTTAPDIPSGIYCFHIRTTSLLGGTADWTGPDRSDRPGEPDRHHRRRARGAGQSRDRHGQRVGNQH